MFSTRHPSCLQLFALSLICIGFTSCSTLQEQVLGSRGEHVIELDEDGRLQTPEVVDEIVRSVNAGNVLLLVYIHGWKHDADDSNSNRVGFRQHVNAVRRESLNNTEIIPVYITWPARRLPGQLENLAYYKTRNIADRVAGGVATLLEAIAPRSSESKAILVGHSMGARIINRSIRRSPQVSSLYDLTLLINAAEDSESARKSMKIVENRNPNAIRPTAVWITSVGDTATKKVFQVAENKTAFGHNDSYITHQLRPTGLQGRAYRYGLSFAADGRSWRVIPSKNEFSPSWWNISLPIEVVSHHNDILDEVFLDTVRGVYRVALTPAKPLGDALLLLDSSDQGERLQAANYLYQFSNSSEKAVAVIQSLSNWQSLSRQGIINHLELLRWIPESVFRSNLQLKRQYEEISAALKVAGDNYVFLEECDRLIL